MSAQKDFCLGNRPLNSELTVLDLGSFRAKCLKSLGISSKNNRHQNVHLSSKNGLLLSSFEIFHKISIARFHEIKASVKSLIFPSVIYHTFSNHQYFLFNANKIL
jgi:hypothetical protein